MDDDLKGLLKEMDGLHSILLPCPFCGGRPTGDTLGMAIWCGSCTQAMSRERWQTRPSSTLAVEWREIGSAPRDGTVILAWHPRWQHSHVIKWEEMYSYWKGSANKSQPTHWQPLPAPPKELKDGG